MEFVTDFFSTDFPNHREFLKWTLDLGNDDSVLLAGIIESLADITDKRRVDAIPPAEPHLTRLHVNLPIGPTNPQKMFLPLKLQINPKSSGTPGKMWLLLYNFEC
jgi:hypothetical protein